MQTLRLKELFKAVRMRCQRLAGNLFSSHLLAWNHVMVNHNVFEDAVKYMPSCEKTMPLLALQSRNAMALKQS